MSCAYVMRGSGIPLFNLSKQWRTKLTALSDAIYQNTAGNSKGFPLGLSWDTGIYGTHTLTPAPSGFSAVTGWGVVYPQAGARSARVQRTTLYRSQTSRLTFTVLMELG